MNLFCIKLYNSVNMAEVKMSCNEFKICEILGSHGSEYEDYIQPSAI
jgi:hypothetical protein